MTKITKKPKPQARRKGDRARPAFNHDAILPARDPLAYAAALQILG